MARVKGVLYMQAPFVFIKPLIKPLNEMLLCNIVENMLSYINLRRNTERFKKKP